MLLCGRRYFNTVALHGLFIDRERGENSFMQALNTLADTLSVYASGMYMISIVELIFVLYCLDLCF